MNLRTTEILEQLGQKAGRYIQHDMGTYYIREVSGADVTIVNDGKECTAQPTANQVDDLMDAMQLRREGSRYYLPGRA